MSETQPDSTPPQPLDTQIKFIPHDEIPEAMIAVEEKIYPADSDKPIGPQVEEVKAVENTQLYVPPALVHPVTVTNEQGDETKYIVAARDVADVLPFSPTPPKT